MLEIGSTKTLPKWFLYVNKEQKVIDAVAALIQNTPYAMGDRLPPERILAKRLVTSRHTLRGALRRLEAQGILAIRPGSGCYVQTSEGMSGAACDSRAPGAADLEAHLEARWTLEPAIGSVAAAKATRQDVVELEKGLMRISRAMMTGGSDQLAEVQGSFHNRLVACCRNPYLERIGRQFGAERLRFSKALGAPELSDQEAFFSASVAVVNAIKEGQPHLTAQRMRELVRQDSRLLNLPEGCPLAATMHAAAVPPTRSTGRVSS